MVMENFIHKCDFCKKHIATCDAINPLFASNLINPMESILGDTVLWCDGYVCNIEKEFSRIRAEARAEALREAAERACNLWLDQDEVFQDEIDNFKIHTEQRLRAAILDNK